MANLNKTLLIGRLTRDPELRHTPSGMAVCEFGIAINRKWKSQGGEMKEETTFIDVTAWSRTAELAAEYLAKGREVFIEGYLKTESWEKDGQKRTKLKVVVENMQFIGGNRDGGQNVQGSSSSYQRSSRPNTGGNDFGGPSYSDGPLDDDIPF